MIHGHGNNIASCKNTVRADFSSNIVFGDLPNEFVVHMQRLLPLVTNYPEPDAASLSSKLAKHHNLSQKNVLASNGSTEAFYLIAHLFHKKKTLVLTPSFAEYEDACALYNHNLAFKSNTCSLSDISNYYDTVWLGNPNNPDGKTYSQEAVMQFCVKNPQTVLVLDEAYAELCLGYKSCVPLVKKVENLIVVRSLTKAFAIPGLRLGYVLAAECLIEKLVQYKQPWSVNTLAIEAGKFLLENYHALLPDMNSLFEASRALQKRLKAVSLMEIVESNCNFILARLKAGKAAELKEFLIQRHGLLIRDASNFRGLNESYFRVAVQSEEYNNLLLKAIEEWESLS